MAPPIVLLMHFPVFRCNVSTNWLWKLPGYHPCMASPALEGLLSHYQRLGVVTSTQRTNQAGIKALHQFCAQYTILPFPASPLTLRYFCCYMARQVSYKIIQLYLAGICLEHLERGFEDLTKMNYCSCRAQVSRDHKVLKLVLAYPLPSQSFKH